MHSFQVDEEGTFVSHELSYPRIRIRRSSEEVDHNEEVHYKVSAFGNDLHLHLKRNRRLLAPAFNVEVLRKHGSVLKRHTMKNCHYVGRVKARSRSTVAMSNCNGLSGLIHTEDEAYFIEPLPTQIHLHDKVTTNGRSKPHIIYRRAANLGKRQAPNTAREKREIHTCGTEDDPKIRLIRSLNDTQLSQRHGPAGP